KIKVPITKEGNFDLKRQQEITEKYEYIRKLRDKEITIGEIFDLSIESNSDKLSKSFVEKHKGNIPVYSASKDENSVDYGTIQDNLPNIKYFENCLTWNKDGSVGKVFFRKGRFSLSKLVFPLIIKDIYKNCFDEIYLKYTIEKELMKHNFGFTKKASKDRIKNIKIKFPITLKGQFNLEKQKEIASKYKQIEEIKEKIIKELEKIENTKIRTDLD
ncbi:2390_t:CDS:2, partial [Funneliformis geosporum]